MNDYEMALAVMDDDGAGCAITSSPAEREQPPFGVPLVRDENGYPVMREVRRNGRVCYDYIWAA